jgi:hypothetical protein
MVTCESCLVDWPGGAPEDALGQQVCTLCAQDVQRLRTTKCDDCGSKFAMTEGRSCGHCGKKLCTRCAYESDVVHPGNFHSNLVILCGACLEIEQRETFFCPNCRLRYSGNVTSWHCARCGCVACSECVRPWPGSEFQGLVCRDCYQRSLDEHAMTYEDRASEED